MDVNDPRTSIHQSFQILPPKPEEVRSGNPLHALLILVSVAVLAILHLFRRGAPPRLVAYALVVALTFVVLSALFRFTVFGSRYHLPFFVLMAPVAAAAFERLVPRPILGGVGLLLFVTSWPYFVRMDVRPILPDRDGRSVFTTDRADLYLGPSLTYSYHGLTEAIAHASCQSVGVMLGGDTAEYPLWPFLGAPRRGLTIEWIVAGTPSERYRRPSFEPCAVVCDGSCPSEWTTVGDLPLRLDLAGYRLFLAP
jgi:hypothetical protein